MQEAIFNELRSHAKNYFDAIEAGDMIRVFRNGEAIARIVHIESPNPSRAKWFRPTITKI